MVSKIEKEDVNMESYNGTKFPFLIRDECYGIPLTEWMTAKRIIDRYSYKPFYHVVHYGTSGNQPDEGATKAFESHYNLQSKSPTIKDFWKNLIKGINKPRQLLTVNNCTNTYIDLNCNQIPKVFDVRKWFDLMNKTGVLFINSTYQGRVKDSDIKPSNNFSEK